MQCVPNRFQISFFVNVPLSKPMHFDLCCRRLSHRAHDAVGDSNAVVELCDAQWITIFSRFTILYVFRTFAFSLPVLRSLIRMVRLLLRFYIRRTQQEISFPRIRNRFNECDIVARRRKTIFSIDPREFLREPAERLESISKITKHLFRSSVTRYVRRSLPRWKVTGKSWCLARSSTWF